MSKFVLDASAVLALLNQEPGSSEVAKLLDEAVVSAVNFSETATRLHDRGISSVEVGQILAMLALNVIPFDSSLALGAADLRAKTKRLGLSLGDRACLATARQMNACAVTTDRAWAKLRLPVQIRCVR